MKSLLGIIVLIIGLLISVGLHEMGHMIPAKRFGVKVPQYAIGFGPALWKKQVGETEYALRAIPLGGYVRLASMLYPGREGRRTRRRNGEVTWAEEARLASAEELPAEESARAFWRLSPGRKFLVMFSGPAVNLVLAALLTVAAYSGIGVPTPTNTIGYVAECVAEADACTPEDPPAPAAQGGLEAGDTVTQWGEQAVTDWASLAEAISTSGDAPVQVAVERAGTPRTLTIDPVLIERDVVDSAGNPVTDELGNVRTQETPYIGISAGYEQVHASLGESLTSVAQMAKQTAALIVRLPVEVWNVGVSLFTGGERSSGVVGVVGVADMAGQITSVDSAQYSLALRIADLLMLLASLNMCLFVFNMLPLLPLDGGHMLGAIIEAITRGWARLRGADDPGPFDTAKFIGVSYVVAMFFIVMTVLLVIADVVNPVV